MRRHLLAGEQRHRDPEGWFTSRAQYWQDVYEADGFDAEVYRRRMATVIELIGTVTIWPGSLVLDAGCGAGQLAIEFARRGACVVASDLSPQMTELARDSLREQRLPGPVVRCDAARLPFPDGTFDCVVAVGVLPWVASEEAVARELARVTRPGGHVLITFDNELRLSRLADPLFTPFTRPVRQILSSVLKRPPRGNRVTTPRRADGIVRAAGLRAERTAGVGFEPPTVFGRAVLRGRYATSLDLWLQRRAAGNDTRLGRLGIHYIVLARR